MHRSSLRMRYWQITTFFGSIILQFIIYEIILRNLGFKKWVRATRPNRWKKAATRFRALAIHMGGVMIKVGQFLSSRLDVLPPEVTEELSGLQDEVPAEDFEAIKHLAESELGGRLEEKFDWFDPVPLAAASLGQVHRARLKSDSPEAESFREIVVKIQRPFINQIVEVDLSALRLVAKWLVRYRPIREHADVPGLTEEFAATLYEEIDYISEAHNAEKFAENCKNNKKIHVPRVVWGFTTKKLLALENVMAIKITDYAAITAAGIDRSEVAVALLDVYLTQIFEDGFFHADPHPGNLFVTPREEGWQLTFVDFGMVGRVPEKTRDGLREMLVAVGMRDAARVVKAYQMLGFLLPGADLKLIEQAEAAVFDRFWGLSMNDLRNISIEEMHQFGHQYRDLILSMPFQVPNDLLMLVRAIAILSGMCTGLDPTFNLFAQLTPYARKLVAAESTGSNLGKWLEELLSVLQNLIALPGQSSRVLAQMEQGSLAVQVPQVTRQIESLNGAVNRLTGSVIFASLLLGGILLFNSGNTQLGAILLAISAIVLVGVLFAVK